MGLSKNKTFPYYPVFLNLHGKKCVVIGGGQVALRTVNMLLETGALVIVISPTLHPELEGLAMAKVIRVKRRDYRRGDLKNAKAVIAATDVKNINHAVAREAKEVKALVNVVDDSQPSDFIIPSYFRRGDLTIAVSTGGMSPALAKKIKTRLEKNFGNEYLSLLSLLDEIRSQLKQKRITMSAEKWQEALDLDRLINLIRKGQPSKAKDVLLKKLRGSPN